MHKKTPLKIQCHLAASPGRGAGWSRVAEELAGQEGWVVCGWCDPHYPYGGRCG